MPYEINSDTLSHSRRKFNSFSPRSVYKRENYTNIKHHIPSSLSLYTHTMHRQLLSLLSPLFFFLLLLHTSTFIQAAVSNMNTPVSPIMPGQLLTLTWINDASPCSASVVQLELVSRTSGQIFPIASDVDPNSASYNWKMPKYIPEGDYYVRMMGGSTPIFTGNFHVNSVTGEQTRDMSTEAKNTNMDTDPRMQTGNTGNTGSSGGKSQSQPQSQPQPQQHHGKEMTSGGYGMKERMKGWNGAGMVGLLWILSV